jgi:hypothetical protein
MSNQPGPAVPGAAAAGLSDTAAEDAKSQTDQGVPVGAADAHADSERAAGQDESVESDDQQLGFGERRADETSDEGVPVGFADVEADRRNASDDDDSA